MRKPNYTHTKMTADNDQYEGKSIERFIEQAETSKQPIEGGAPIIFTARKDGVMAEYNIRTDRFELAQNAMNKVAGSIRAKRADYIKASEEQTQAVEGE